MNIYFNENQNENKNKRLLLADNNNINNYNDTSIIFSIYDSGDIIEAYPHPWIFIKNGINGILTLNIIIGIIFFLFIIFIIIKFKGKYLSFIIYGIYLFTFIMIILYTPLSIIIYIINLIQTFYIYCMYFVLNNYDKLNIYTNDKTKKWIKQKFVKFYLLISCIFCGIVATLLIINSKFYKLNIFNMFIKTIFYNNIL